MSKKLNQAILNLELLDKIMDKKLPWIKITPETELPNEQVICIKEDKHVEIGWLRNFGNGIHCYRYDIGDPDIYNPTHYCIITNPEE